MKKRLIAGLLALLALPALAQQVPISQLPVPATGSTFLTYGDIVPATRNGTTYGLRAAFGNLTCPTNQYVNTMNGQGAPSCMQPAIAGISGAGTAATAALGVSGGTLGLLNGNLTYSGNDQFTGGVEIGTPTGGMPSAGVLNAAAIEINGVLIGSSGIYIGTSGAPNPSIKTDSTSGFIDSTSPSTISAQISGSTITTWKAGGEVVLGSATIGTSTLGSSKLTVNGGVSIGTGYVSTTSPTNGAIIQGPLGLGTTSPGTNLLQIGTSLVTVGTDGGMVMNSATSGDQGAGTINVSGGFYVNGVSVAGSASVKSVTVQTFCASGCTTTCTTTCTYTPNAHLITAEMYGIGGGGGSGGVAGQTSGANVLASGGGAAGSTCFAVATAATIGASQTVTVGSAGTAGASGNNAGGNGGQSSVGTLCTAPGGGGGGGAGSSNAGTAGVPGSTGTGSQVASGMPGGTGLASTTGSGIGGSGGTAFSFGAGGASPITGSIGTVSGNACSGYGSGSSGSIAYNTATNVAGIVGCAGKVTIVELNSQ